MARAQIGSPASSSIDSLRRQRSRTACGRPRKFDKALAMTAVGPKAGTALRKAAVIHIAAARPGRSAGSPRPMPVLGGGDVVAAEQALGPIAVMSF